MSRADPAYPCTTTAPGDSGPPPLGRTSVTGTPSTTPVVRTRPWPASTAPTAPSATKAIAAPANITISRRTAAPYRLDSLDLCHPASLGVGVPGSLVGGC